jgi:hypothetical protein
MATAAIRKLAHRQQMRNELVKLCNFSKEEDGSAGYRICRHVGKNSVSSSTGVSLKKPVAIVGS